MKKVLIALASVLAITAGCTKEEFKSVLFGETAQECPVKTVKATIESRDTKASLNFEGEQPQMCWEEGDTVAVFGRIYTSVDTQNRAKYALNPEYAGQPQGEFEYVDGTLDKSNIYYAVYPYSATTKNSVITTKGNDAITVEFPSKEKFNTSTLCAEGANIMVAKFSQTDTTDAPVFYFRNLCSYIEFYAEGPAEDKLQSAIIKTKDGSAINGIATCKFGTNDEISLEFDGKGTDAIVVTFYDSETGVEGIDFGSDPIDIALPPFIDNGFTLTLVSVNGLETTVSSDAVLGRNTVTTFEEPIVVEAGGDMAASVAGVEYPSFISALKAANEEGADCTIKLLRDCYVTGVAEVSNANAVITLDLNGKTLTSVDVNRINVLQESKGFVIEDNSVEQTGTIKQENAGGNAVLSYGHLEINSGTIIGGLAAVYVYNGDLIVNGGTFKGDATSTGVITVNSSSNTEFVVDSVAFRGGLVEASSRGTYFKGGCRNITFYDGFSVQAGKLPLYNSDCGITINGGEFHSESTNPVSDRTSGGGLVIHSGWFSTNASVAIVYGTKNQTFVDGGYFSRNVGADYVKAGYQSQGCDTIHNGVQYLYEVVPQASQQAVLTVEGEAPQTYSDGTKALLDAVAAGKDCEVKLLASFTINANKAGAIEINAGVTHTITIDLNGFSLNTSGKNNRLNVNGGHLIIRSTGPNAAAGTIACLPADSYSIYQTAGEVTIEGGRFIGAADNQYYLIYGNGGGKMTIKGGQFENDYFQTIRFQGEGSELNILGGEFISQGKTKKGLNDTLNEAIYITTGATVEATGGYTTSLCAYGESNVTLKNGFNADIVMKVSSGPSLVIEGCNFDKGVVLDAHSAASVIDVKGGTFSGVGKIGAEVIGSGTVNIENGTFSSDTKQALKQTTAVVNIKGGEYTATNKFGTIWSYDGGGITIDDATVVSGRAEGQQTRALYVGDGNNSAKGKGKIEVNGGKYTAGNTIARIYGGNFTVNGGTFTAQDTIFHCGSIGNTNTVINGGYFNSTNVECDMFCGSDFEEGANGGHYNRLFDDIFIAAGKKLADAPVTEGGVTYQYAVVEDPDAKDLVIINGTAYQSYSKAFKAMSALEGPIEVKLLEDGKCSGIEFNDKQEISIDLNGKVLTTSVVSSAKTLSISDGSIEGTGELAGTKSLVALTVNAGTVTMTGGTISGSSNGGVYLNGPTQANHPVFNMSGGKIVSDAKPASLGGSTGTYASLSIIDGGEFNFSGGVIENTAKTSTALFIKSSSADNDIFPEFNMTGGQIKGAHYAFYPYTHAKVNFMGGQITTNNRISHNGTSNKDCVITIKGGYFHATGYDAGKIISGYNANSVKAFHISGGYWNDDPIANGTKAHSSQPLKLEDGYKVVKLETPVVIGDLTYNYQVVAK